MVSRPAVPEDKFPVDTDMLTLPVDPATGLWTGKVKDSLVWRPMMEMMRGFVIEEPGGPEKLELREMPRPKPRDGWVLIHNRAFGLNRSEWFTRRGESPAVKFPRVLGIECVGEVVAAPGTSLSRGARVAALMGGMGRQFDGSYAEYVLVRSDPRDVTAIVQLARVTYSKMVQNLWWQLDITR